MTVLIGRNISLSLSLAFQLIRPLSEFDEVMLSLSNMVGESRKKYGKLW